MHRKTTHMPPILYIRRFPKQPHIDIQQQKSVTEPLTLIAFRSKNHQLYLYLSPL